jgi:hypothetical protein
MKLLALLIVAVAAGTIGTIALSQGHGAARSWVAGSCAAAVEWAGTTYAGDKLDQLAPLSDRLGNGTLPACVDTNAGTPALERSVSVVAIEGVPSREAVAIAGDRLHVYVAPGYFPQLPRTPLHDVVYGPSTDVPDERGDDCKDAKLANVRASVRSAHFGFLSVQLLDSDDLPRQNWIFSDAHTVVDGGGAEPHVDTGDVVRAQVLVCRHPNDAHFLKLVALRLQTS